MTGPRSVLHVAPAARRQPADSIFQRSHHWADLSESGSLPQGTGDESTNRSYARQVQVKNVKCGVPGCNLLGNRWFPTPEEKRTDVNIAVFMLDDAYQDICDHLVVFSGDSYLVPAVNMVRRRFPNKKITVYVPSQHPVRGAAVELRTSAHAHRTLPALLLSRSQFPDQIPDGAGGFLRRPTSWR